MSVAWFIAKRYLAAQRRRGFLSFLTVIAVLGVMLGTAALIITLSVLDGFEREIKVKVVDFTSHIEVEGFQNLPLPYGAGTVEKIMRGIPDVKAMAPFAAREGMIRIGAAADGIFLKGVDPAGDVLGARRHLVEGTFPAAHDSSAPPPIVIGRKLALRLDADTGMSVVVFALERGARPGVTGTPRAMKFRLTGIYESGMAEFDDVIAYTTLADAQRLLRLGNDVSGYDVLVRDIDRVDTAAAALQAALGYPHYARTVFQLYRNLFSWVELQKKLSPMLLALIIVVATANIIGTLLMFVLEKASAVAVLRSLGAGPRLLRRIFLLEGLAIGSAGIVLGNLLALGCCWLQLKFRILSLPSDIYYMDTVPILLSPANFGLVTAVAFVLCLLTCWIPSRAASSLSPVALFRFG